MTFKRQLKLITVACIAAWSSAQVQATNLIEIYESAAKNDPTFLASQAKLKSASLQTDAAMSAWLPKISASYSTSESNTRYKDAVKKRDENGAIILDDNNIPVMINSLTKPSSSYSISLTQSIYSHEIYLNLGQAEKQVKAAEIQHESIRQQLFVRVAEAYFNMLAANDALELAQAETKAIERQLEQTIQKNEVGLIAITEVHEAQANYDSALASEILAQNDVDNSQESLREITGSYYQSVSSLSDRLELKLPTPTNIDDWVNITENNNLSIQASKLQMDVAMTSIDIKKSGHLPTVSMSAGYSGGDSESFAFAGDSNTSSISITVSIPIFEGFSTSTGVQSAKYLYQESSHNLEKERRSAIRQARSGYLGVNAAIRSVQARAQSVTSSESALEATQAGADAGTRTIVEVLTSTKNLYSAKRQLLQAKYQYIINLLKLKQAAGVLTKEDIIMVNSWLK
jgi:outer membrane protein